MKKGGKMVTYEKVIRAKFFEGNEALFLQGLAEMLIRCYKMDVWIREARPSCFLIFGLSREIELASIRYQDGDIRVETSERIFLSILKRYIKKFVARPLICKDVELEVCEEIRGIFAKSSDELESVESQNGHLFFRVEVFLKNFFSVVLFESCPSFGHYRCLIKFEYTDGNINLFYNSGKAAEALCRHRIRSNVGLTIPRKLTPRFLEAEFLFLKNVYQAYRRMPEGRVELPRLIQTHGPKPCLSTSFSTLATNQI